MKIDKDPKRSYVAVYHPLSQFPIEKNVHLGTNEKMSYEDFIDFLAHLYKVRHSQSTHGNNGESNTYVIIDDKKFPYYIQMKQFEKYVETTKINFIKGYKDDGSSLWAGYAYDWIKFMQYAMEEYNKTLSEVALDIWRAYISIWPGLISTAEIECVVNKAINCWQYGNELKIWLNNGGKDDIIKSTTTKEKFQKKLRKAKEAELEYFMQKMRISYQWLLWKKA